MLGYYGDRVSVNGRSDFTLDVASRAYRLRILNGLTRVFNHAGRPNSVTVDRRRRPAELLEKAETRPYVMLAPPSASISSSISATSARREADDASGEFYRLIPPIRATHDGKRFAMGEEFPLFTARVTKSFNRVIEASGDALDHQAFSQGRDRQFGRSHSDRHHHGAHGDLSSTVAPMATTTYSCANACRRHDELIEIFHERGGMGGMGMMGGASCAANGSASEWTASEWTAWA